MQFLKVLSIIYTLIFLYFEGAVLKLCFMINTASRVLMEMFRRKSLIEVFTWEFNRNASKEKFN